MLRAAILYLCITLFFAGRQRRRRRQLRRRRADHKKDVNFNAKKKQNLFVTQASSPHIPLNTIAK